MQRERTDITPSLIASMLMHGGLVLATLIVWPWFSKPVNLGSAVPVTIVTEGPPVMQPPAELAPEEMTAAAPEPEPLAAPEPPAPPQPTPSPAPAQKTAAVPLKPSPKPRPALDLDALLGSLPSKPRSGRAPPKKGPAQAETSPFSRPTSGPAMDWLAGLSADLGRRWNPNCEVEGGSRVDIKVSFRVASSGRLISPPQSSQEYASDPVVKAASDRAKRAVRQAEPFADVPAELAGEEIAVRFNAQRACAE